MFEIIKNGIFYHVSSPEYGKQDVGVTPGGAMDSFSMETGNAILKNKYGSPAIEIILAPTLRFRKDCWFIITGAKHRDVFLGNNNKKINVQHREVCFAEAGSIIEFNNKEYGFRSYLCYAPAEKKLKKSDFYNASAVSFNEISSWNDEKGRIRVIEGPEYKYLVDRDIFLQKHWKVSNDISSMGMRIENKWADVKIKMKKNMVSEAVSNGTIQLTPDGPIILLKHRQTIGGYPRIFNVISADVDTLAQFAPGQVIHFKKVSVEYAHEVLRKRKNDIMRVAGK